MPDSITIRRYRDADAEALAQIYLRAVQQTGPRDYTPAQVAAWASLAPDAARIRLLNGDGRETFVAAAAAGAPLGFTDLEADGHVNFLYGAPEAAGRGVAAALTDALEARARVRGMARLHVEASAAARRFYLKRGWHELARRDFEVAGIAIHNYAMALQL
ncbi:GNAT family N-acetyltransferase [Ferrovibrio sp.]|uniref:GNAT family N-acetyltransferase n=1 Tax=Ferrovibrio sp. TaxID=1917215 RepID=UPI003512654F